MTLGFFAYQNQSSRPIGHFLSFQDLIFLKFLTFFFELIFETHFRMLRWTQTPFRPMQGNDKTATWEVISVTWEGNGEESRAALRGLPMGIPTGQGNGREWEGIPSCS